MTKLEELKTALANLIGDNTSVEQAEQIGKLNKLVEDAQAEENKLIEAHSELRKKYVEIIKTTSFPVDSTGKKDSPNPKTFEECLKEQIKLDQDKK